MANKKQRPKHWPKTSQAHNFAVIENSLLDQYGRKLQAQYREQLEINSEFDMIAFIKTVHEELGVGPGRAFKVFNAFMANKLEIAETIHEDYGPDKQTGDKQILHTKSSYAKLMKRIFGAESWQKVKTWFPLLYEYWED